MGGGSLDKEIEQKSCISDILTDIKELQDLIIHSRTKYFGKLLAKVAGVDTIPIILQTSDCRLKLMGHYINEHTCSEEPFHTVFFRIQEIDKKKNCATVELLLPLNIHGEYTDELCDTLLLRRTADCSTIDLSCLCGVQPLDTDLMKRKIIIEPKW